MFRLLSFLSFLLFFFLLIRLPPRSTLFPTRRSSDIKHRSTTRSRRFQIIDAGAEQRPDSGGGWVLHFASCRDGRGASTHNRRGKAENRRSNQELSNSGADVNKRRRNCASTARSNQVRPVARSGD